MDSKSIDPLVLNYQIQDVHAIELEWKDCGLEIWSTTSNEAVKLYDAALTQFSGLYDDPNLGGLENTLIKLNNADPNFILGQTLTLCTKMLNYNDSYFTSATFKNNVDSLENLIEQKKNEVTKRERKHVQAISKMSKLDWNGAVEIYEDILVDYQNDILALKMAFYNYFFTGQKKKQLDLISKAYPNFVKESNPFSIYIDGFLAFVLEETFQYKEAIKYAKLGLSKNPYDGWATHALAHVYEMEGHFEEGRDFMRKNIDFWSKTNHIAYHNFWHLALFSISTDNFDEAIFLYDEQILPRLKVSKSPYNVFDASSLLMRLSFLNNDKNGLLLQSKFKDVYTIAEPYLNQHILGFGDVHYLMTCLGSGHKLKAKSMLKTIKTSDYMRIQENQAKITEQLMESIIHFDEQNHECATDILASIRDSIILIGGSDAQRDVFNQLLIVSAMKSSKQEHKQLIQELIVERENFKKNDRFIQQFNKIYQQQ